MNNFLKIACKAAYAHEKFAHAKVCAVLVRKRKIVAFGFNHAQTHPLAVLFGKNKDAIYLHAEVDCIRQAIRYVGTDLSDCSMYVARVRENGDIACAAPCSGCKRALEHFSVGSVEYTNYGDGNIFENEGVEND